MTGVDTNVFIYFLERNPEFFKMAVAVLEDTIGRGEQLCVPTLIMTEILSGTDEMASLGIFSNENIRIFDLNQKIASYAGQLRYQNSSLRTPDAIHIATAICEGADKFVTNDERLLKLKLDIRVVPLRSYSNSKV